MAVKSHGKEDMNDNKTLPMQRMPKFKELFIVIMSCPLLFFMCCSRGRRPRDCECVRNENEQMQFLGYEFGADFNYL